jgi:hypothetical protein
VQTITPAAVTAKRATAACWLEKSGERTTPRALARDFSARDARALEPA